MSPSFTRVCALSPRIFLGDCKKNQIHIQNEMEELEKKQIAVTVFPELCLTGSTCGDLFFQPAFQKQALEALEFLCEKSRTMITIVGLPLAIENRLYNVAAVMQKGEILGLVPKKTLNPEQKRWFSAFNEDGNKKISLLGQQVPFGNRLLFSGESFSFSVQVGQDSLLSSSAFIQDALSSSHIIFNPRAASFKLGTEKNEKQSLSQLSQNCNIAAVTANAGDGESTTDHVFAGQCYIYENGDLLSEDTPFSFNEKGCIADIDLQRLAFKRQQNPNITENSFSSYEKVLCFAVHEPFSITHRFISSRPFLAEDKKLHQQVKDVFQIQKQGLKSRLRATGINHIVLGVSGGLDSTLALLCAAYTLRDMNLPPSHIHALIMPGFGTTTRTKNNGTALARHLACTIKEIDIMPAVRQHFEDIGHSEDQRDITYENSQARERTQILMDYANQINGLVLGTGNLSESALGFSTYNADHMSMYNPNASIPKTLVKSLVSLAGNLFFDSKTDAICQDIVKTPISPELLPGKEEQEPGQKTEEILGSYDLHDFFLYHMMDSGSEYDRLLLFAQTAFEGRFEKEEIEKTLTLFIRRFYTQQFKRSCMPDGPQVVFFSLSPRGGLSLPSDLSPIAFLP